MEIEVPQRLCWMGDEKLATHLIQLTQNTVEKPYCYDCAISKIHSGNWFSFIKIDFT